MKRADGFTLIELIITLVVAAIIVAVGIPGMSNLMANNRATAHTDSLITALSFARSESVKRGISVSVCAIGTTEEGTTSCGGASGWSSGWFARLDAGDNEQLRSWPAPPGDYSMEGPAFISFNSSGALQSDNAMVFVIEYSHCSGNQKRTITVQPAGHTSVTKGPCTPDG
ncbi:MAG: GspH/FimT family pseudopilin [Candidatus Polarisedimenticolaceae bacterium]|nr:GspH/FimT family pseudopilin [Candidatus Polarisedimenticolaceae bacterium]